MKRLIISTLLLALAGCATAPNGRHASLPRSPEADLAVLRRQLEDIHGSRDAAALSALHTEGTVFDWRGRSTPVTGRVALEKSRRETWASRRELRLMLEVAELRIHSDSAYEFGSYEQSWIDQQGRNISEFGRYVTAYAREADGQWRIARTFGFADLIATKKASE